MKLPRGPLHGAAAALIAACLLCVAGVGARAEFNAAVLEFLMAR